MSRVADIADNYIMLDGAADFYFISDALVNPLLAGAPIIAASGWGYLTGYPASERGLIFIPDAANASGFSVNVQASGLLRAFARSRDSGTVSTIVPGTTGWADRPLIREWFHILAEADYRNSTHRLWLNGQLVGMNTAVAWEDSTFSCTPAAAGDVRFGSGFWPGSLGPLQIFLPRAPMTPEDAWQLHATGNLPVGSTEVVNLQIPDIVSPVDRSPNAFPVVGVSIASPYGPKHRLFGGFGR